MSPRDAVELQQIERIQDRIACLAPAVTADEARRIAINVAKLPGLLGRGLNASKGAFRSSPGSSWLAQAASTRLDQPRLGLRRRFAIRSSAAADERSSLSSAHRTHLAAKRSHVALLSGDRANLAIARHSPANFLNSSDGFMGSPPYVG